MPSTNNMPEKPSYPGHAANIEEKIAWIRLSHAYNDAITDIANRAFDEQFRKTMRK